MGLSRLELPFFKLLFYPLIPSYCIIPQIWHSVTTGDNFPTLSSTAIEIYSGCCNGLLDFTFTFELSPVCVFTGNLSVQSIDTHERHSRFCRRSQKINTEHQQD